MISLVNLQGTVDLFILTKEMELTKDIYINGKLDFSAVSSLSIINL